MDRSDEKQGFSTPQNWFTGQITTQSAFRQSCHCLLYTSMPGELARAFREGISFDAAAFPGFASPDGSDLLLFPDPTTLSILPWRPSQGRVVRFYCEIRQPDGQPFPGDGRFLLRQAVRRARERDLTCKFGTECEFYLFQRDEAGRCV